jgi:D-alanine-D-alanine ligase
MELEVGLTYNLKRQISTGEGLPEDSFVEFDDEETVDAIAHALEMCGCKVTKIEANEKAYSKLMRLKPHIVFNIAEGLRGESRESQVPAMLEMLDIPYTGSGPLALAISLDKCLTHQLLNATGISSLSFQVFTNADTELDKRLAYPLIVKPLSEGSSKGVRNNSLVENEQSLRNQVSWVMKTYDQPAIVEQFLPGREFTVSLIGNDEPTVLPIVEILFDKLPIGSNPLYSYEAKWIWDTLEKPLKMFSCPAEIPNKLEEEIRYISVETFRAIHCRDICRVDIRLDENGKPQVMEVNPLPGMIPNPDIHSCLPAAATVAGITYDQLICTILWVALKRYGLQHLFKNQSQVRLPYWVSNLE